MQPPEYWGASFQGWYFSTLESDLNTGVAILQGVNLQYRVYLGALESGLNIGVASFQE